ncbi:MAG: AAA family ATPase [Rhodospirillales bacterium]|nr:AAA family ATPase [Rhodospirillales bacterium]
MQNMIHRIEIENFGSIRERQVIDLSVPATAPELERFPPSKASERTRLPTVVAFFGPNASGKSTALRAAVAARDFAVRSFEIGPEAVIPWFVPFRAGEWRSRPTRISIDFDAPWIDETLHMHRYQLAIGHGEQAGVPVIHESLSIKDGRRFRNLFLRKHQEIRCASELELPPSDARLKAVRANASVISTMAQFNHEFFRRVQADVTYMLTNIAGHALFVPQLQDALRFFVDHEEALKDLREQLARLDVGINDINIVETSSGLLASFTHEGLEESVHVLEESNGTRRFILLFPLLWYTLQTGRPAIIDEFDVDLHPMLIPEILNWFQDPELNPHRAQLFLAAHNVSIMEHLEKEEIFLVEKARDGASEITALKDIRGVRREPSLQRKYLGGVFGAVPNIG